MLQGSPFVIVFPPAIKEIAHSVSSMLLTDIYRDVFG